MAALYFGGTNPSLPEITRRHLRILTCLIQAAFSGRRHLACGPLAGGMADDTLRDAYIAISLHTPAL